MVNSKAFSKLGYVDAPLARELEWVDCRSTILPQYKKPQKEFGEEVSFDLKTTYGLEESAVTVHLAKMIKGESPKGVNWRTVSHYKGEKPNQVKTGRSLRQFRKDGKWNTWEYIFDSSLWDEEKAKEWMKKNKVQYSTFVKASNPKPLQENIVEDCGTLTESLKEGISSGIYALFRREIRSNLGAVQMSDSQIKSELRNHFGVMADVAKKVGNVPSKKETLQAVQIIREELGLNESYLGEALLTEDPIIIIPEVVQEAMMIIKIAFSTAHAILTGNKGSLSQIELLFYSQEGTALAYWTVVSLCASSIYYTVTTFLEVSVFRGVKDFFLGAKRLLWDKLYHTTSNKLKARKELKVIDYLDIGETYRLSQSSNTYSPQSPSGIPEILKKNVPFELLGYMSHYLSTTSIEFVRAKPLAGSLKNREILIPIKNLVNVENYDGSRIE